MMIVQEDTPMLRAGPIITCLSDFGTRDHYVAAMKGVMLSIAPQASIIDITHDVPAHDVLAGAFALAGALPFFPTGTIHLAVVDPGVGSDRRILAGRWEGQVIVAPDNGLVSFLQARAASREVHEVTNHAYFRDTVSPTFHGRDILAPTVAHLAAGLPLAGVGPRLGSPVMLKLSRPRRDGEDLVGRIIHVDRFGNLITNITSDEVLQSGQAEVLVAGREVGRVGSTYADVAVGSSLALIGSAGLLEIAVRQGRAADQFGATVGSEVLLRHL